MLQGELGAKTYILINDYSPNVNLPKSLKNKIFKKWVVIMARDFNIL